MTRCSASCAYQVKKILGTRRASSPTGPQAELASRIAAARLRKARALRA
jgi:hypothetical protein